MLKNVLFTIQLLFNRLFQTQVTGPYDTGVVFNILNDEFPGYPEDTKFGDILYCQGY